MAQNLQVHLVQPVLAWEQPERNRKHVEKLIFGRISATDLIVLPEMFTTGFSMQPGDMAETYQGQTLGWMQDIAAHYDAMICGSLMFKENDGTYRNRMFWVSPSGVQGYYDKRHLFSMAGEHQRYKRGQQRKQFIWKGWNIMPLICYDLRFPVFSRNTESADLYLYVANWPLVRRDAWKHLLTARAIENQVYVAGVNIVGRDGNGIDYAGDSAGIDPLGNVLCSASNLETVLAFEAGSSFMAATRKKLPFLDDRDSFTLHAG